MEKPGRINLDSPTIAALLFALLWASSALLGLPPATSNRPVASEYDAAFGKIQPCELYAAAASVLLQNEAIAAEIQARPLHAELLNNVRVTKPDIKKPIPRLGWEKSPLHQAICEYDDKEFRKRFRLSRGIFNKLVARLTESGYVRDNKCQNPKFRTPAWFKVGVALLHLSQGGTWWQTGFCAGISESLAQQWTVSTCRGIVDVLRSEYMKKPSKEEISAAQGMFAARRGIMDVGAAVDGTHVPWQPDQERYMEHFHNYKGWYSISVVALVNSYYMFMDAEVGRPGRMSDSTAMQLSYFYNDMLRNSSEWLGENGMMLSDGACGMADFILTPYAGHNLNAMQQYFNFCHSSTRMFVEQTFGQWKSRWRVLIKEQQCSHGTITLMTYATMVLHNMCTVHLNECGSDYLEESFADIIKFMREKPEPKCAHCRQHNIIHCVHKNRRADSVRSSSVVMRQRRDELAKQLWFRKMQREAAM